MAARFYVTKFKYTKQLYMSIKQRAKLDLIGCFSACFKLLITLIILSYATDGIAQTIKVTGTVQDWQTNVPINGVSITVQNSSQGTSSDFEGRFSLNVPTGATLIIAYVGYLSQQVPVAGKTTFTIRLQEDQKMMDEVVVVGYGIQRKTDLTGSITSVKAKDINGIRNGNAAEALQGKSGLNVVTSGNPGGSPVVRIRGVGSNSDATPIYVVDGVMTNDISFLNPKDIESMEILKDASATAIYGSRGANGVIMVTTKKGKSGKPVINYSGNEGFQRIVDNYKSADASQYAILQNMIAENAGTTRPYTNPSQYGVGTNWLDEITRRGSIRDHQLSVAGGSEAVIYNISAGYNNQQGNWNNTKYERWTLRVNNEYKITDKIRFGHNATLAIANTGQPLSYRMVRSVMSGSPLISSKNETGGWNSMQNGDLINPAAELELNKDFNNRNLRFLGNVYSNWNIIDGLSFRTSLGADASAIYERQSKPIYNINPSHQSNPTNYYREYYTNISTWLWENTLNYNKEINKIHRINLLAGYTMEKYQLRGLGANALGYLVYDQDYITLPSALATNRTVEATQQPAINSRMSYLARANYSLMDKYLLTASIRADGSSKFGTNNRWGYFPSAALGWRIKEESFLKNVSWLSNLKLRASLGVTGNDKIPDNVSYPLVSVLDEFHAVFNGAVSRGAGIIQAHNPDVKWERSQQFDIGAELGFLNDRLTFEFDYFNKSTKDLLIVLPLKGGSVGIAPTYSNMGEINNKGFEGTARWQDDRGTFKYGFALSASAYKNEVTDWKGGITTNNEWSTNLFTRIEEGQPFNYFYGYKTQGIYRTSADLDRWNAYAAGKGHTSFHSAAKLGDLIYVDVNGDGKIDEKDQTNIGNPYPKITGNMNLNAQYKGFDIYVDFAYSLGGKMMNNSFTDFTAATNNMHEDWLNSWTPSNVNSALPRLVAGSINTNRSIDIMVFNADYVKLRSAELGYSLPDRILEKTGMAKLRLSLNAANLWYFTKYKGYTPEIFNGLDYNSYPMARSLQIGLNATF